MLPPHLQFEKELEKEELEELKELREAYIILVKSYISHINQAKSIKRRSNVPAELLLNDALTSQIPNINEAIAKMEAAEAKFKKIEGTVAQLLNTIMVERTGRPFSAEMLGRRDPSIIYGLDPSTLRKRFAFLSKEERKMFLTTAQLSHHVGLIRTSLQLGVIGSVHGGMNRSWLAQSPEYWFSRSIRELLQVINQIRALFILIKKLET